MSFVLFYYQQKDIRTDIKKAFKTKELSVIRLNKIKWYKKNKEIIVNGTLFDISKITKQKDGTYLVEGLYDHQEQKLHKMMDHATSKNQKSPLLVIYASCFVSNQSDFKFFAGPSLPALCIIHTAYYHFLIPQFQPAIYIPPPKVFC